MEKLKVYSPNEAVFVTQFENAIRAQEVIEKFDCQRIQLTVRREGQIHAVIHEKKELMRFAQECASRRWTDLKALGLEDVANDIVYQHELRKYR